MTLVLVIAEILFLCFWGLGLVIASADRHVLFERAAAVPAVGLGGFLYVVHCFAALGVSGRTASLLAAAVLVHVALFVTVLPALKARRLSSPEVRGGCVPLGLGLLAVALVCWPLIVEGYDSFIAFGNPDAAYTLAAFEEMLTQSYGRVREGTLIYWPNPQPAHLFGAGYLAILLATVFGVPVLNLHEVVSAALVFVAAPSVFLFARLVLRSARWLAVCSGLAFAVSSQLSYTFHLQSLGALTLIAMAPAAAALWWAGLNRRRPSLLLLAAALVAGTSFGYYAAMPVLLLLLTTLALPFALGRRTSATSAWLALPLPVLLLVAAYPRLAIAILRRTLEEALSSRLQASLEAPEVLLSFAFTLTEDLLPFLWGLAMPPLATGTSFAPTSPIYWLAAFLSLALFSLLLVGLLTSHSNIHGAARLALASLIVVLATYFATRNAYGVFKLAGWISPFLTAFGTSLLLHTKEKQHRRERLRSIKLVLFAALLTLNCVWSARIGLVSLSDSPTSAKPLVGYTHRDLAHLRQLARQLGAAERLLVMLPDPVLQRWALTYLRPARFKITVLPYLPLSPDQADPYERPAAIGYQSATYVLIQSSAIADITANNFPTPVWASDKFQVLSLSQVRNLLVCGSGWYRVERAPEPLKMLSPRMRWLRSRGELFILNPANQPLRLRLVLLAGHGKSDPNREVRLLIDDEEFDRIFFAGAAALLSRPFRCEGRFCRITLVLNDEARPLPRPLGLINAWVPGDARRLNIGVFLSQVLADDEYRKLSFPCTIDLGHGIKLSHYLIAGLYADNWATKQVRLSLGACGEVGAVLVEGFVPGVLPPLVPLRLLIKVNGVPLQPAMISEPGRFVCRVPLPPALRRKRHFDVAISSTKSWIEPSGSRSLSFRLEKVSMVAR